MTDAEFNEYSPLVRSMCNQFCKRFSACNYIDRWEMESAAWECFARAKKHFSGGESAFRFYFGVALKNALCDVANRQKRYSVLVSLQEEITPGFCIADLADEMPEEYRRKAKKFRAVRRAWRSLTDDQRDRARVLLAPQKYGEVKRLAKMYGESPANYSCKLCRIKRILRARIQEYMSA